MNKRLQKLYPNVPEALVVKVWNKIQEDGENFDFEMLWSILDEVKQEMCAPAECIVVGGFAGGLGKIED